MCRNKDPTQPKKKKKINNKKDIWKTSKYLETNTFINYPWVKEEIKRKIRKFYFNKHAYSSYCVPGPVFGHFQKQNVLI